jgi:hypothetical protein
VSVFRCSTKKEAQRVTAGRDQFCIMGPVEWVYRHGILPKDRVAQALLSMINF